MMAGSTKRSKQRPDTLMQDRNRQLDENLLQRTAGPYIRVRSDKTQSEHNESAFTPTAAQKQTFGSSKQHCEMPLAFFASGLVTLRANGRSAQKAAHHRHGEKYRPQGHVEPGRSAHRRIPIGIGRERGSIGIDVGFCDHGLLRGLTNRQGAAGDL